MASPSESGDIRVLTWNINGLKAKLKKKERKTALLDIFDRYDIVLLQETHIGGKDWDFINNALKSKYTLVNLEEKEEEDNEEEEEEEDDEEEEEEEDEEEEEEEDDEEEEEKTMYMTNFSSASKGVAIIVKKPHTLLKGFCQDGEYAWVHVQIDNQKYTFVSVYYRGLGPNLIGNLVLKIFYSFLTKGSDVFKCRLVIGGDFNTTLDPELDATTHISDHTARRKTLNAFLSILKLSDVWRKMNRKKCEYTYKHKNKNSTQSRLDYVFMLENDVKYVKSCKILKNIALSDHSRVSLTLNYTDSQKPREE